MNQRIREQYDKEVRAIARMYAEGQIEKADFEKSLYRTTQQAISEAWKDGYNAGREKEKRHQETLEAFEKAQK